MLRAEDSATESHSVSAEVNREVLDEAAFRRLISVERKRSERSGKSFLLMLLDTGCNATKKNENLLSIRSLALYEGNRYDRLVQAQFDYWASVYRTAHSRQEFYPEYDVLAGKHQSKERAYVGTI